MQDWTLLRQLIADRRLSYPEVCKALNRRAQTLGSTTFELSDRQFKRLVNGQVKTQPLALTCRVLEAEFGHPIEALLGPATGAGQPSARAADRALQEAALTSAGYAMWQSVDQLSVETLQHSLRQLARDYVHGEMLPVVDGIVVVRQMTVEWLPRSGEFQRSLYMIAGLSSAMLAHAAGNLGRLSQSPAHAHAALRFAELGRVPGVGAWALAVLALQQEWSGYPQQSLLTGRRARSLLPDDSADSTAVWLSAIEARAHARLGNAPATRAALEQAARDREAISQHAPSEDSVDQFGGIIGFSEAKQHYYAGTALRRVGEMEHARLQASAAIDAYERGPDHERSYGDLTLARLDLAIAHASGTSTDLDAVTVALEPVTRLPQPLLLPTLQGHLGELVAAVSQPKVASSRQAVQVRNTAMALSTLCTPRPAPITS